MQDSEMGNSQNFFWPYPALRKSVKWKICKMENLPFFLDQLKKQCHSNPQSTELIHGYGNYTEEFTGRMNIQISVRIMLERDTANMTTEEG